MEVRVRRVEVTPGPDSLCWSPDGVLAIAASSNAVLHVPDFTVEGLKFARIDTPSLDSLPVLDPRGLLAPTPDLSIGRTGSQIYVAAVKWSPTGLTARRGCFLAHMSSGYEVHILQNLGDPKTGAWEMVLNVGQDLLDRLNPNGSLRSPREFKIHAFAWSPAQPAQNRRWNSAFLCAVAESGHAYVYRVQNAAFELVNTLLVAPIASDSRSDSSYARSLVWTERGLILGYSDNSVVHMPVEIANETPKFGESRVLLAPSRIYTNSIRTTVSGAIIVAQTGQVTVLHPNAGANGYYAAKPQQLSFIGIVCGLVDHRESVTLVSYEGETDFVPLVPSPDTMRHRKIQKLLVSGTSTDSALVLFGGTMSLRGNCCALLHSTRPLNTLTYPIPSTLLARLTLFYTEDVPPLSAFHAVSETPALFSTTLELAKLQSIQSDVHSEPTLEPFQPDSEAGLVDQLRDLAFSKQCDALRTEVSLGDPSKVDAIRKLVAQVVLGWYNTHAEQLEPTLVATDRAVLQSFALLNTNSTPFGSDSIELAGDGLTETFAFAEARDPTAITAVSGRSWKRCAMTLLPILALGSLPSTDKQFVVLQRGAVDEHAQLAYALLEAADFCIYTGARWHNR